MSDDLKVGDLVEYWRTEFGWFCTGGGASKRATGAFRGKATVLELRLSARGKPMVLLQDAVDPNYKMNRYVRDTKKL